jgi:tetratricopeptide (TPR) repeat protein
MLGLTALAGAGLASLLKHGFVHRRRMQVFVWGCIGILTIVLGSATYARSMVWKNTATMWNDTISKSHDPLSYYQLGSYYIQTTGQSIPAIDNLAEVIAGSSKYFNPYDNRGIAYMGIHRFDLAIADFTLALQKNPNDAVMLNNRATAYIRSGKTDSAFADYTMALKISPRYAEIYIARGTAYADMGKFNDAVADFTRAIDVKPELLEAYDKRASCYYQLHRYAEALSDLNHIKQTGVEIDMGFVHDIMNAMGK